MRVAAHASGTIAALVPGMSAKTRLTVRHQPSPQFVELLEKIEYGTEGVRYVAPDTAHTLQRLAGAVRCVELREEHDLVGTYLVVERTADAPAGPVRAAYRTCLAVAPTHQGRGFGRQLVDAVKMRFLEHATGRVALYGTIDPSNTRSMALAERAGYQSLATLRVATFTRLIPYRCERVGSLRPDERESLLASMRASMGHHALFDAGESLRTNETLVYRIDGDVVAAAQFIPKKVELTSLGGKFGRALVKLARRIPGLRRLARPTTVLQVASIWAEDEHRAKLIPLFEDAMVRHGTPALVMLLDVREPLHEWLLGAMRLGWLDFWTPKPEQVRIMAGFRGLDDREIATLTDRPFWVSALDLA